MAAAHRHRHDDEDASEGHRAQRPRQDRGVPPLRIAQDPAADELLGRDPLALLIGMLLGQQLRERSADARRGPGVGACSDERGAGSRMS
jgi:hypothetical protein